jgi:hypothetical protein
MLHLVAAQAAHICLLAIKVTIPHLKIATNLKNRLFIKSFAALVKWQKFKGNDFTTL